MIEITMTINGRPLTSSSLKDELEKAALESVKENIREQLSHVPHELDGERLIVEIVGPDLHSLSVQLSGPDSLVEQAKVALGAE